MPADSPQAPTQAEEQEPVEEQQQQQVEYSLPSTITQPADNLLPEFQIPDGAVQGLEELAQTGILPYEARAAEPQGICLKSDYLSCFHLSIKRQPTNFWVSKPSCRSPCRSPLFIRFDSSLCTCVLYRCLTDGLVAQPLHLCRTAFGGARNRPRSFSRCGPDQIFCLHALFMFAPDRLPTSSLLWQGE